jgi:hypothetical protein
LTTVRQEAKPKISIWPRPEGDTPTATIVLDQQVVAFSAQKNLNSSQGSFSITVLPAEALPPLQGPSRMRALPELYRRIGPGAIVQIGFQEKGGIMIGVVTRVERRRVRGIPQRGGRAEVGLVISGADFGKILAQDAIVHASLAVKELPDFLGALEAVVGPDHVLLEALPGLWGPKAPGRDAPPGVFEGASVQAVVDFIIDNGISTQIPQLQDVAGGTGLPGDFINTEGTVSTWNDDRIWSQGFNDYQGNLWQFIKGIVDEDFYEVFVVSVPPLPSQEIGAVSLVVRPKPFDEDALDFAPQNEPTGLLWPELTTYIDRLEHHEIQEYEVVAESLGISDNDTFSYYEVIAQHDLIGNDKSAEEGLYYPLIDTFALKRYGLRTYKSRLTLMAADIARKSEGNPFEGSELHEEVQEFRNRLFNWHRLNEFFETGSVTVAGRDTFRPGDPVFLPWLIPRIGEETGLRFYMVGCSWSWSWGAHYICELSLTRGHNNGVIEAAKELIAADAPDSNPSHFASV